MFNTFTNATKLAMYSLKAKGNGDEILKDKSLEVILNLLASERGLAIKIAQILGSNAENSEHLHNVTNGQELRAIPLSEIIPIIEDKYNKSIDEIFESIDEAKWVASLGQVHPCKLKGRPGDYVVKIQYPGIKEKIKEQLKLMGLVGHLGSKTKLRKWGFDISDYLSNIENSLNSELNYFVEWENLKTFSAYNKERNLLYPNAVDELVKEDIFITRLMPGISIDEFARSAAIHEKRKISEQLLILYLEQLLADGFVQGDTHKGNFYIYNNKIVFLDFGHFLKLNAKEINALKLLFEGMTLGRLTNHLAILADLGFDPEKLQTIHERIPLLMEVLFRPFGENQAFDLQNWHPGDEIEQIIGEEKWWFRSSGNARFFQLLRSFWGPYLIIKDLKIPINWHQCAKEVLIKLEKAKQVTAQKVAEVTALSQHLRIEVFRDGQKSVDLFLPARATLNLEKLLDEKVKDKIEAKGISVQEIKQKALQNNLAPMILFELTEANKRYKVYLN